MSTTSGIGGTAENAAARVLVVSLDAGTSLVQHLRQVTLDLYARRDRISLWTAAPRASPGADPAPHPTGLLLTGGGDAPVGIAPASKPWTRWPERIEGGVAGVASEIAEAIRLVTGGNRERPQPFVVLVVAPAPGAAGLAGSPMAPCVQLAELMVRSAGITPAQRRAMTTVLLAPSLSEDERREIEPCVGAQIDTSDRDRPLARIYDAVITYQGAPGSAAAGFAEGRRSDSAYFVRLLIDILDGPKSFVALKTYLDRQAGGAGNRFLELSGLVSPIESRASEHREAVLTGIDGLDRASAEPRDANASSELETLIDRTVAASRNMANEAHAKAKAKATAERGPAGAPSDRDTVGSGTTLMDKIGNSPVSACRASRTDDGAAGGEARIARPTVWRPYTAEQGIDRRATENLEVVIAAVQKHVDDGVDKMWGQVERAESEAIEARKKLAQRFETLTLTQLGTGQAGDQTRRSIQTKIKDASADVEKALNAFRMKSLGAPRQSSEFKKVQMALGDGTARLLASVSDALGAIDAALDEVHKAVQQLPAPSGLPLRLAFATALALGVPAMWLGWWIGDPTAPATLSGKPLWPVVTLLVWIGLFAGYLFLPALVRYRASMRVWKKIEALDGVVLSLAAQVDRELHDLATFPALAQQQTFLRKAIGHLERLERERQGVRQYISEVRNSVSEGDLTAPQPALDDRERETRVAEAARKAKDARLDLDRWLDWVLDKHLPRDASLPQYLSVGGGDRVEFRSTFFMRENVVSIMAAPAAGLAASGRVVEASS